MIGFLFDDFDIRQAVVTEAIKCGSADELIEWIEWIDEKLRKEKG